MNHLRSSTLVTRAVAYILHSRPCPEVNIGSSSAEKERLDSSLTMSSNITSMPDRSLADLVGACRDYLALD